jgi:hypothetical protein
MECANAHRHPTLRAYGTAARLHKEPVRVASSGGRLMAKARPADAAFGGHRAQAGDAGAAGPPATPRRALVGIGAVLSIANPSHGGRGGGGVFFSSFAPGSPSGTLCSLVCSVLLRSLPVGDSQSRTDVCRPGSKLQTRQLSGASCKRATCSWKWKDTQFLPRAYTIQRTCCSAHQVRRGSAGATPAGCGNAGIRSLRLPGE